MFARLSTFIRAVASVSVLIATSARAEPLAGSELKNFVNGKRIYLATPFGGEFPLTYKRSGAVTGDGTALGLGKFLAPRESGRWWIKGGNLCQQWPSWYDGKPTCFQITKTGDKSLDWVRQDGRRGTARIEG